MRRFRLRTLMIAVAVVAVMLGMLGRWMDLHRRERYHRHAGTLIVSDLEMYLVCTASQGDTGDRSQEAAAAAKPMFEFQEYHCAMQEKYERAFRHPWFPVAFDPPAPPAPSLEYQKAFRAKYVDSMNARVGFTPGSFLPSAQSAAAVNEDQDTWQGLWDSFFGPEPIPTKSLAIPTISL
jgi:hypothetical protein